jgi:two-component system, OmpR family, response regulator
MYTVLIVDDNPSIVEIFVNMLEQGGYHALSATSGEGALEILRKFRPDIVLLDILMEPMDGWQTLEQIKTGPPSMASVPVMMLTAKPLSPDEAQKFGLSIEDYINKPITRRALYDAIDRFFQRRDRMETHMQIAGEGGASPETLKEYRTLCRATDVQKRLLRILEHVAINENLEQRKYEEITSAVREMKENLSEKKERLEEIRHHFLELGITPDDVRR